jgi:hypothetical protein
MPDPDSDVHKIGPFPWYWAQPGGIALSANFTDPWAVLYVKAGQGDLSDVDAYTEPIPLVAGARLTAILGFIQRRIFTSAIDLLGLTTVRIHSPSILPSTKADCQPFRTIITNSVLHLQADPAPPNVTDTVTLRLRIRKDGLGVTRVVEDFTDASVLAGLATLGGFWTFTDGAFAIIFGANILYFLWSAYALLFDVQHIFPSFTPCRNQAALGARNHSHVSKADTDAKLVRRLPFTPY